MATLTDFHTVDDFRRRARRSLPGYVFDFIEGGAGAERARARNETAFAEVELVPRLGARSAELDLSTHCLGQPFDTPVGIAPLGLGGLVHPEADLMLARVAARCRIPFVLSATSNTPIERICRELGSAPWFQFYAPRSPVAAAALLDRADGAGCPVLVVTADVAAPGKRLRDLRNGLQLPLRPSLRNLSMTLRHPRWALRRLAAGPIAFPNLASPGNDEASLPFSAVMAWQTGGALDWHALARLRERWPRQLVLKGVLAPQDAQRARQIGYDAVVVSNHGGRQFDAAPAPIAMLPLMRQAGVTPDVLMLDSGVRSGEDVVKALALGAGMVFLGRPFLFALASGGEAGVERLVSLLREDVARAMSLLGMTSLAQAGHWHDGGLNVMA
jgi:isopentenyl diphosphate isomerase/L-lactate dehydrogenase-like FMN-dependent dehydrogenase